MGWRQQRRGRRLERRWRHERRRRRLGELVVSKIARIFTHLCAAPAARSFNAEALAKIAKVDIETHAKNMFKAGSDFKNKTTEEIFYSDFKIFHTDEFDFGVAQISAMSREELDKVAEKLRPFLKEVLGEKRIDMVYVMLTDILEESSKVIFEGHDAGRILADAFEREENENGILLEGIISRKKQLIPTLMNAMAEKV